MSRDWDVRAEAQEVTAVRLLVSGAVGHGAHAAHREQCLSGEQTIRHSTGGNKRPELLSWARATAFPLQNARFSYSPSKVITFTQHPCGIVQDPRPSTLNFWFADLEHGESRMDEDLIGASPYHLVPHQNMPSQLTKLWRPKDLVINQNGKCKVNKPAVWVLLRREWKAHIYNYVIYHVAQSQIVTSMMWVLNTTWDLDRAKCQLVELMPAQVNGSKP